MNSDFLTKIVDFLPDATFAIDSDSRVIAWNKAMEAMTGVKRADVLGHDGHTYSVPFYGKKRPLLIDLVLKDDCVADGSYYYVKKQGSTIYAEAHVPKINSGKGGHLWGVAAPLIDEDGNCMGAIESIRDITYRKNIESKMKESEEKYRSIFENAVEGIFQSTPDGRYLSVNPAYARMFGYESPEELIEKITNISEQTHVSTGSRKRMMELLEEKGVIETFEAEIYRKDGSAAWVSTNARAVRGSDGKTLYYEGTTEDITERRIVEEKFQKETKFNRTLIQDSPTFYIAVAPDGRILLVNRSLLGVLGYRTSEIIGKDCLAAIIPQEERESVSAVFRRNIANKEKTLSENHIIGKNGVRRLVEWHSIPVVDERNELEYFFGVGIDITERKKAEETLKKREAELVTKSRDLEEFNTTLKVLLKQREQDKLNLEENIMSNIEMLIMPFIEKLKKCKLDSDHMTYVDMIESGLNNIVSPFVRKISSEYTCLTPTEMQVANFIKCGKTTKEIGELLHVSQGAINFHRNNIRKKLGLNKMKVNLTSYLSSLP